MPELNTLTVPELFLLYSELLTELRGRGIVRSTNNPVADYAELLCERAFSLTRTAKSTKGLDGVSARGDRFEIKARRLTSHNKSRQLSAFRDLDKGGFDHLAGVLFNEDFSVWKACLVPHAVVFENSTYNEHSNSWIFHLRDSVWSIAGAVDITEDIRRAEVAVARNAKKTKNSP